MNKNHDSFINIETNFIRMKNNHFQAATHQKDITPPIGTLINGEFYSRYANKINDMLYAKSLILQDEVTLLVFVVVDICAMQQDFLDEVKYEIQEKIGVPKSNILISSTHTHSAGAVVDLLMGHVDIAYRKRLKDDLVKVVVETLPKLKPAKIAFGEVDIPEHVVCRRYKMASGYKAFNPVLGNFDQVKTNPFGDEESILERNSAPDHQLSYLAVKGIDDKWISVFANYGLHYVGDAEEGTISADYFGYFAKHLKQILGADEEFLAMLTNGTSGEVNIWDFFQPDRYPTANHAKSEFIGKDIAIRILPTFSNLQWEDKPSLGVLYKELPVKLRKPSATELSLAKRIVMDTDYRSVKLNEEGYRSIYAREQVLLAEYPDQVNFYVQSFKIGTGIIGALGGEFFAETGLSLKAATATDKYFTVCLANDYVGYVPPAHEIAVGGYETWRCRTSFLENEAEEKIKAVLLAQIKQHENAIEQRNGLV